MNKWINIDSIDLDIHKAFVYHILNNDTNEQYIGKKNLFSYTRKYKTLKDGTKAKKKTKHYKESNWDTYQGSSDITNTWTNITKTILIPCTLLGEATYHEIRLLWENDVLSPDSPYVNRAIGNFRRYYK